MRNKLSVRLSQGLTVTLAVTLLAGVGYVLAAPTVAPPGSSLPLPLTTGATAEIKAGLLTLQAGLNVSGGSGLCLGGTAPANCKTAWPASSVQAATTAVTNGSTANVTSCYIANAGSYTDNYNQTYYYYCDSPFSVTVPFSVATVSVATSAISCSGPSQVYHNSYPYGYVYYAYQALNPVGSLSGNNVLINGTCRIWTSSSSYGYSPSGVTGSGTAAARYVF